MINFIHNIEKSVQPQRTTLESEQTSTYGRFLQLLYLPYSWWYKSCSSWVQKKPLYTIHWVFTMNVSLYQHPDFDPSTTASLLRPCDIRKKGMSTARKKCHKEWRKLHCSGVFDFLSETTFQQKSICLKWCLGYYSKKQSNLQKSYGPIDASWIHGSRMSHDATIFCWQTRTSKSWGIPAMAVRLSWTRWATRAMPKNTCECHTCGNTTRVGVTQ